MRRSSAWMAAALAATLTTLSTPALTLGAEPPNQNDPCGTQGRNTCNTTGSGFYTRYRYGTRWFGDFRRAVPAEVQTFCIDLRFWYPSPAFKYAKFDGGEGLKNRDGKVVSVVDQQKMAYALWTFGRTDSANQQAAVMLYVHQLMGDGEVGEVDPAALGATVSRIYGRVVAESMRYRNPTRVEVSVPDGLAVGTPAAATVRVRSVTGAALPNVRLTVSGAGADGLPSAVRTNAAGVATIRFVPSDAAAGMRLKVQTERVASTLPSFYTPTLAAPRRNGQRLAAPAAKQLSQAVRRPVAKAKPTISSTATPAVLLVGEASRDRVRIRGLAAGRAIGMQVRLFGPFRSTAEISCEGTPFAESTLPVRGAGAYTTQAVAMTRAGIYTYQLSTPETPYDVGVRTPCGVRAETIRVEVQPRVRTVVSSPSVRPGSTISDTVTVEGLSGEPATVSAALYGPFPALSAIKCDVPPVWSGSLQVSADGEYKTDPTPLATAGYYVYREQIAAAGFVRAAETACNDVAETAIAIGTPRVTTQVSAQETRPGSAITDSVVVTGLGVVSAQVQVELWGPYPTREAMSCSGTPAWTGTVAANGDGTYQTAPFTITTAGYYTYREQIAGSPANDAASTPCGEASETTIARARPAVTTIVSDEVVESGAELSDRIRVNGLGKTPATINVSLFGPFASKSQIRCDGEPFWRGQVNATGDGELRSPAVRVRTTGFYTYRERLVGSDVVAETTTECGEAAETALVAPEIHTGRGDARARVRNQAAVGPAPTRVRVPTLGIDAPVAPAGIDTAKGLLAVPVDISRAGWWVDGASPVDGTGTTLIAGHVDSARAGRGAFFRLKEARAGTRVEVVVGGRTVAFKVTTVRTYLKRDLPNGIWSQRGGKRLVLVTCGGPFDAAAGAYRDNVVATAVPV